MSRRGRAMSALTDRIAEVLVEHPLIGWSSYNDPHFPYRCAQKCNVQFKTKRQHAAHVAQRIEAELAPDVLTRLDLLNDINRTTFNAAHPTNCGPVQRWIEDFRSAWSEVAQ